MHLENFQLLLVTMPRSAISAVVKLIIWLWFLHFFYLGSTHNHFMAHFLGLPGKPVPEEEIFFWTL